MRVTRYTLSFQLSVRESDLRRASSHYLHKRGTTHKANTFSRNRNPYEQESRRGDVSNSSGNRGEGSHYLKRERRWRNTYLFLLCITGC